MTSYNQEKSIKVAQKDAIEASKPQHIVDDTRIEQQLKDLEEGREHITGSEEDIKALRDFVQQENERQDNEQLTDNRLEAEEDFENKEPKEVPNPIYRFFRSKCGKNFCPLYLSEFAKDSLEEIMSERIPHEIKTSEFLSECTSANLPRIKELLTDEEIDINYENGTCLVRAIAGTGSNEHKILATDYLMQNGATFVHPDDTPLTWAIADKNLELVNYYIDDKKIDPNSDNGVGMFHAIQNHDVGTLHKLIESGTKVTQITLNMLKEDCEIIPSCIHKLTDLQKFISLLENNQNIDIRPMNTIVAEHIVPLLKDICPLHIHKLMDLQEFITLLEHNQTTDTRAVNKIAAEYIVPQCSFSDHGSNVVVWCDNLNE